MHFKFVHAIHGSVEDDAPNTPDLAGLAKEFTTQLTAVGEHFKEAFDKVAEEAQYHFDKELGKALAKHPELYAELRRTYRQARKTLDKAASEFGLK